ENALVAPGNQRSQECVLREPRRIHRRSYRLRTVVTQESLGNLKYLLFGPSVRPLDLRAQFKFADRVKKCSEGVCAGHLRSSPRRPSMRFYPIISEYGYNRTRLDRI